MASYLRIALVGLLLSLNVHVLALSTEKKMNPLKLPVFEKTILENGMSLWLSEDKEQPVVFFQLMMPIGTLYDPLGKEGMLTLISQMLEQGTRSFSGEDITRKINQVGGRLTVLPSLYGLEIHCQVLKKDIDLAISLIQELSQFPTFPAKDLERKKKQSVFAIKKQKTDPDYLATRYLDELVFGPKQRSGREATIQSISKINQSNINDFYYNHASPVGTVLVCIGDINSKELKKKLTKRFSSWAAKTMNKQTEQPQSATKQQLWVVNKEGLSQTTIALSLPGLKQTDPEFVAYRMMNYILGASSFSSRLMNEVRVKKGLTYSIYSSMQLEPDYGLFTIKTFTRNEEVAVTIDAIKQTCDQLINEGMTKEELDAAKSYYRGNLPIRYETPLQKASHMLNAWQQGLSDQEIRQELLNLEKVTLKEVNTFIKRYFKDKEWQIVLVSDYSKIKDQLKKSGLSVAKQLEVE
ncbi:MAG: pitrilysin family protein [bacterium]